MIDIEINRYLNNTTILNRVLSKIQPEKWVILSLKLGYLFFTSKVSKGVILHIYIGYSIRRFKCLNNINHSIKRIDIPLGICITRMIDSLLSD